MDIEFLEKLEEEDYIKIDDEFNEYAKDCGVACDYRPFNFVAIEDGKKIGYLTGHTYYKEVHVSDLIVLKEYRHKHVGRIKQLDCKNREDIKDRVATYMFIPNMNIFDLPKDELKRLKGYIESNFKNVKWALNYNLILDGVKVQAKEKVKQTEKVKELVYQS